MNNNDWKILGREESIFRRDVCKHYAYMRDILNDASVLVIGGAGTIGQAVCNELFKLSPSKLHVVDISENNLVEVVRDLRSSQGYRTKNFATYALDVGSVEFEALVENEGPYDYVFNLSALKHVRSEKDPYTLMRMLRVNVFNTVNAFKTLKKNGLKKYFCVSTD